MAFSMQKNRCCNLDFHQDYNIYDKPFETTEKLVYFAVVSACDVAAGCGDGFV